MSTGPVEVLRKLDTRAADFRLEHDFLHVRDVGPALHGNADDAFPELHRPVDVADIDAELPDAVFHVPLPVSVAGE